ncbi:MAG: glycosyltransferase, partial [Thermoanaerobaculia bacterium]|nr:glycosyltransferase [Thermoanaerobaculia bacterium]
LFHRSPGDRTDDLLLAVGRLTPKKGFEHLLSACAILRRQGRPLRCIVIGSGRCRARLERLRSDLDLDDVVELRNSVRHDDLPRWYRRAAVFAMPAQVLDDGNRDGIPNVLLEAMACGTPVVASRVSSIPEVVEDGRTGLLVPPRDPAALADAIGRLLDDPLLAAEIGRSAAASVASLDYRRANRPLVDEFRSLVGATLEDRLDPVERRTWQEGGMAEKAARRLGVAPRRDTHGEAIIRDAIAPGIRANAWRPDLDRLVERRLWDEVFKARRLPALLGALGIESPGIESHGARILDLGAGRGGLSVGFAARGHRVVALDLRYRNCLVTRLRGRRYDFEIPATTSIGEQLPFAAETFDAVSCLEVLEHVLDPIALLGEIRRVLRPGGACVLTVINRWAHLDPHYRLWGINFLPRSVANRYIALRRRTKESYRDLQTLDEMHYYRFGAFVRLAQRLGFEVEDAERPEGFLPSRLHDLKRKASLGFDTALVVIRPAEGLRQLTPRSRRRHSRRAAAAK